MSTTDNEKAQLDYLEKMGKFRVDIDRNHKILQPQEIEVLERYGHLFEALTSGKLLPYNSE